MNLYEYIIRLANGHGHIIYQCELKLSEEHEMFVAKQGDKTPLFT